MRVVGIRFRDSGKIYYFDPNGLDLRIGDPAVVETVRGLELGKVAEAGKDVGDDDLLGEIKRVLRRPTAGDYDRIQNLTARQMEALTVCSERVHQHNLPMRLVKAEYNFDGTRLTFYFTAEARVDFRALVRDLARTFRTRIELRQVGPRDGAKLLGGIGPCGRPLCCATFLPDFARVSIKMAKDQDLPLNPSKISGVCGRLLCCLSYEHEQYQEIKAELPPRGAWVQTPEGPGEVVAVNVVRESVTVDVGGNPVDVTLAQISAATGAVASEARARLDAGAAAPVTRERRGRDGQPPAQGEEEFERLNILDEDVRPAPTSNRVRFDQSLGDAPPTTPQMRPERDQGRRRPQRGDGQRGDGQRGERQGPGGERGGRPPQQRRPMPEHPPHRLVSEDMELKTVPELHERDQTRPAGEQPGEGRSRRRRRRRGGGGGGGGAAGGGSPRQQGEQQAQGGQQGGQQRPRQGQPGQGQPGQGQQRPRGGPPSEGGSGEQRPGRPPRRRR